MANYFRITAYNPNEDVGMIVDSNGKFEKLWQFSLCSFPKVSKSSPWGMIPNSRKAVSPRPKKATNCSCAPV